MSPNIIKFEHPATKYVFLMYLDSDRVMVFYPTPEKPQYELQRYVSNEISHLLHKHSNDLPKLKEALKLLKKFFGLKSKTYRKPKNIAKYLVNFSSF
jgi:hypothetical protein